MIPETYEQFYAWKRNTQGAKFIMFEEFKAVVEFCKKELQAPSADYIPTAEEWKQMQREYHERCEEVSALAIQLEQLKAPSATVDEPKHLSSEQRQELFNFLLDSFEIHLLEDEFNTIESIVFPITYPYTLKDSQQPTVDVDETVKTLIDTFNSNEWESYQDCEERIRNIVVELIRYNNSLPMDLEQIAHTKAQELVKMFFGNPVQERKSYELFKGMFASTIAEALRGSYTREELLRNRITELESENVRLIKMIDGE